jgi:ribosomal protein L40E
MSLQQQCLSCDRPNPSDAAFCENCGSPLNLKLCEQCEAINQSRAEHCHKCSATFVARAETPVRALRFASPVVATRARRVPRAAIALGVAALTGLGGGLAAAYVVTRPKPPAVPAVAKPLPVPVVGALAQKEELATPAVVVEQPAPPSPSVSTNPPVTHTKRAMDANRSGSDTR